MITKDTDSVHTMTSLSSPTPSASQSDDNSSSVGVIVAIVVLVVVVFIIITVVVVGIIVAWKRKKSKQHTKRENVYYTTNDDTTVKRSPATEPGMNDGQDSREPQYMDIPEGIHSTKQPGKVAMQDNPAYFIEHQVKLQDNPAYSTSANKIEQSSSHVTS